METYMLKLNYLILMLVVCSCSGINVVHKKKSETEKKTEYVFPGQIKQIFVSESYNEDFITCEKTKYPISGKEKKSFVYAESYFSNMKNKICQGEGIEITIAVRKKDFPFETIKVDRKRVSLSKKDLKRVKKERKVLKQVYNTQSLDTEIDSTFKLPLNSFVTSHYGKRRMYNNIKKGQHLGIDFRAKVGKEIEVANNGKVVLAQDLFYTGNTVIVYHGLGIFTIYGHLSKINVKNGESVLKGDVIGLAGMTGRVTGPHLHWGVKVNGHWVNGNDLLSLKF